LREEDEEEKMPKFSDEVRVSSAIELFILRHM